MDKPKTSHIMHISWCYWRVARCRPSCIWPFQEIFMSRSLLGITAFLFVAIGSPGCTEAPAPESVGYVSIPLTAAGAGGVTYRLSPGTTLFLNSGSFFGSFPLDEETSVKTVKVPPGTYSVNLFGGNGETTVFSLTRENANGTFDTVPGTLNLTPTITVAEDETTPLVIRFQVPIVGPITFALGSVDVSVVIDETKADAFDIALSVHELTTSFTTVGDTAPAQLPPRLPAPGDTGDSYVVTMHTVGTWALAGENFVCAPVAANVKAGGNQGFTNLVAEAPPSEFDQICIQQVTPQLAFVTVSFFGFGAAKTPLLSDLGDVQFFVTHNITASVNARVFDGTTLHLNGLEGLAAANMSLFGSINAEFVNPDGGTTFDSWYQFNETGNGTIALTPR